MTTEAIEAVLRGFEYAHLPAGLQVVARRFAMLAEELAAAAPADEETPVALRKLLEARDAALRAVRYTLRRGAPLEDVA